MAEAEQKREAEHPLPVPVKHGTQETQRAAKPGEVEVLLPEKPTGGFQEDPWRALVEAGHLTRRALTLAFLHDNARKDQTIAALQSENSALRDSREAERIKNARQEERARTAVGGTIIGQVVLALGIAAWQSGPVLIGTLLVFVGVAVTLACALIPRLGTK